MFYVLHGEDEYSIRQEIEGMKAKLGDATMVDLNTTVLDGRSLALDELRTTCDTMPFLSDRRLVIVEGLLARFEPRAGAAGGEPSKGRSDPLEAGMRDYLPHLPDSARLVFVERGALGERNPLLKMCKELGGIVREYKPPAGVELSTWIAKHTRTAGGAISARATETLGAYVGGNLRLLAQEIDKLVAYTGGREIQEGDVSVMVADTREVKVWSLTDALVGRQRHQAIGILRQLLDDGEQPPVLMAVIARQFRNILQIKELSDERMSATDIAGQLKLHPYMVQKAVPTARTFSYERIDAIYHHLVTADLAVKTGRLAPDLALELLVIELTGAA